MSDFDFDMSDFDRYKDYEQEEAFKTAYDSKKSKDDHEMKLIAKDPFGRIEYPDEGSKPVARISIYWFSGDVTVEEYSSPTRAKMRWQDLNFLHRSGLTIHVARLHYQDLTKGVRS